MLAGCHTLLTFCLLQVLSECLHMRKWVFAVVVIDDSPLGDINLLHVGLSVLTSIGNYTLSSSEKLLEWVMYACPCKWIQENGIIVLYLHMCGNCDV